LRAQTSDTERQERDSAGGKMQKISADIDIRTFAYHVG
jgi:hypothetical protein